MTLFQEQNVRKMEIIRYYLENFDELYQNYPIEEQKKIATQFVKEEVHYIYLKEMNQ